MKILSAEQIRSADLYTIENEPISSIDLMERAANVCFDWISDEFAIDSSSFHIFCGIGNNGGDGLVIARLLAEKKSEVIVHIIQYSENVSEDFKTNLKRLDAFDVKINTYNNADFKVDYAVNDIAIDAIFGTGLNKPISGWLKDVVKKINALPIIKLAIDLPSGLASEFTEWKHPDSIIKADVTLTFQQPKLAMVMEQSSMFCGEWHVLDIGLDPDFIENIPSNFETINEDDIWLKLKERGKFQHKNNFGHALLISGSKGKIGAAVLAAKASLRSGIGLLTTLVPKCGYTIMQTSVPEAMCLTSTGNDFIDSLPEDISRFNSIGVGPGIGTEKQVGKTLQKILELRTDPIVIDADALNILSENKDLLTKLPQNSILTPHVGEFKRLVGEWNDDKEKLQKQIDFSKKYKVIIVLKGPHTSISDPSGKVYFNTTGNPGMATAGSGDVLLGMITTFLARGYEAIEAATIGVFLHGLAGDFAAFDLGVESMNAGDIIRSIPQAFLSID